MRMGMLGPGRAGGDPAGALPASQGPGQLQGDFPCASTARSSTNEPSNWQHGNILCSLSSGKRRVRKRRSPARAGAAGGVPPGAADDQNPTDFWLESEDGDCRLAAGPGTVAAPGARNHPGVGGLAVGSPMPRCAAGRGVAGPGTVRSGAPCLSGARANPEGGGRGGSRPPYGGAVTARFLQTVVNPTD